jgi:monoamine oxidase
VGELDADVCVIGAGYAGLTAARRIVQAGRRLVLTTLEARFGSCASQPLHYEERDWAEELWSRGCYMAHMPPGVVTSLGPALRAPVGRIHWAGTETATVSHGTIDGAIRSGERAAAEVLAATESSATILS